MKLLRSSKLLSALLIAVSALCSDNATVSARTTSAGAQKQKKEIHVDKTALKLYLIQGNDTIYTFPISAGSNKGQKTRSGDRKTPEGTFSICQIQNSTAWIHDANDGLGPQKGLYGPWFFRLKTPMSKSIGIHGSKNDQAVGKRASEGCVRLRNSDLVKLKPHVFVGMKVIIHPDK